MAASTRLKRGVGATAVAIAALTPFAPGAAAAPAPPPIVHQVAGAPYSWLFDAGLQVYEQVDYRPSPEPHVPIGTFVMRRLHGPDDGRPGTPRYVYVGQRLPEAFEVSGEWGAPHRQSGFLLPLDPTTLKRVDDRNGPRPQMIWLVAGRIGEIAGIGLVTDDLG